MDEIVSWFMENVVVKILAITSGADLSLRRGCIPAFWQLFKALYELGVDLIVVPYRGRSVESLWWNSYENPCLFESTLYSAIRHSANITNKQLSKFQRGGSRNNRKIDEISNKIVILSTRMLTWPKWKRRLIDILEREKDVDVVVFLNIPLNQIKGIPTFVKRFYGVRVLFFDGDMPVSLPSYYSRDRLVFNYYVGANLSEYDGFIINSEGAVPELEKMGAHNVNVLHWGVDPNVYSPIGVKKHVDVFFYGHGGKFREKWVDCMIVHPSRTLTTAKFVVGGFERGIHDMDLGLVEDIGHVPFAYWRGLSCRSKINLNITRKHHAEVYASSTSRIFELASLGCCIVSNPINGLNEWFDVGKEVMVVENEKETLELYKWLLPSEDIRLEMGNSARRRVLEQHTMLHRAKKLLNIIKDT